MAVDIPASRDLALIFEREDVKDAFVGHCARTHLGECSYCAALRVVLATAIMEWKAICELELAATAKQMGRG